ncbi:MAG: hypothetical protein IT189_10680 [Microbacteriaceae bacterium]|jgi:hypothetical protein|nr:hypothetical protein [Microbacteriaceae bacterium]
MPSFSDPAADAEEMWQSARGLAHATRGIDRPEDVYDVFGAVTATLRALTQSLEQIAHWNLAHTERAQTDDGSFETGADHARAVAFFALGAASTLGQATDLVMMAHSAAGRIAWQPAPAVRDALATREVELTEELDSDPGPHEPPRPGRALD